MKSNEPVTLVVFRRYREGSVIALFPELPSDREGRLCDSYQHVGQHGAACYFGVVNDTKPATAEEAEPLKRELEGRGYRLRVIRRAVLCHHVKRRSNAKR